jgi:hypothetical protein
LSKTPAEKRKPRRAFGAAVRTLNSDSIQASYLHEGKRYTKTFPKTTPTPPKVANDWLAVKQSEIVRHEWIDPDTGSEIFREYAEDWLARGVRQGRIRPTTEAKCRSHLHIHILPTFGDLHIRKITPRLVNEWYEGFGGEEASDRNGGVPSPGHYFPALCQGSPRVLHSVRH